jgi:hypothetical protein
MRGLAPICVGPLSQASMTRWPANQTECPVGQDLLFAVSPRYGVCSPIRLGWLLCWRISFIVMVRRPTKAPGDRRFQYRVAIG